MTRPGPNVTSDADTQPGSDSLFPTGFSGGGALVRQGSVGTGEIADGSVASADLNLSSVATALAARSEFTGTYAPIVGASWVAMGDSLVAGSNGNGQSWVGVAGHSSGQRLRLIFNGGVAGERSDQILARMDAAITTYAPKVISWGAGTNDIGQARTLASYQANTTAALAKARAAGALFVITSIPPRNDTTANETTTALWNAWLARFARANRVLFVDFHALLVDPATGLYNTTYSAGSDGIHPNGIGHAVMGQAFATAVSPFLPTAAVALTQLQTDASNLVNNGTMTRDNNADGFPDFFSTLSSPAGFTHSLVSPSAGEVVGKWFRTVVANPASAKTIYQSVSSSAFTAGDVIAIACVTAMSSITGMDGASGLKVQASWNTSGGTQQIISNYAYAHTRGVVYAELTVPAGATGVDVQIILSAPSSSAGYTVDIGQFTVYNLTRLGIV